ncbi:hypothetical protein ACLOJK_014552, partial [Asimina triloba]
MLSPATRHRATAYPKLPQPSARLKMPTTPLPMTSLPQDDATNAWITPPAVLHTSPHPPRLGPPHSLPPLARCQQCLPSMPDAVVGSMLACRHGCGKPPVSHDDDRCRMRIIRSCHSYSARTTT